VSTTGPIDLEEGDESLLAFSMQQPGERYVSLEELEEGYGDDSDGPDYDGYTAKERELREIGGVAGMSMEIIDAEMAEPGDLSDDDSDDWYSD
jgi:hypothetical protein